MTENKGVIQDSSKNILTDAEVKSVRATLNGSSLRLEGLLNPDAERIKLAIESMGTQAWVVMPDISEMTFYKLRRIPRKLKKRMKRAGSWGNVIVMNS